MRRRGLPIRILCALIVAGSLSVAISCGGSSSQPVPTPSPIPSPTATPSPSPSPSPTPTPRISGFEYRGVSHASYWGGEYGTAEGTIARAALADTGVSWTGLLVSQYQESITSTSIYPTDMTPTDTELVQAITEFHNLGMKVMLKPHVDPLPLTEWRGNIRPADADMDAWFASYRTFILHYAQIANDMDVDMLAIGTELRSMTGADNAARWTAIITAIRDVYHGPLTYCSNAASVPDEFNSVSFWDQVDVIGLDNYFSLTNLSQQPGTPTPTVDQLVSAWTLNWRNDRVLDAVESFHNAHPGRPIMFTEIGYRSTQAADYNPWDYVTPSGNNETVQRNCYQAAFLVWSARSSWLRGMIYWDWTVPAPGAGDTSYNPRGKAAEEVLRGWR